MVGDESVRRRFRVLVVMEMEGCCAVMEIVGCCFGRNTGDSAVREELVGDGMWVGCEGMWVCC